MTLPVGVFKGMGLWRAATISSMESITSLEHLDVGEHCFISGADIHHCVGVSSTGSDWSLISGSAPSWQQTLEVNHIASIGFNLENSASFLGPVTSSLGFSGSLTRLIDGRSYLAQGTGISITSESNGPVTIASTVVATPPNNEPIYQGFASGSKSWTSTTWDAFTNVADNLIDVFQDGITRSGAQFTFVSSGFYQVNALFNALATDNYLGFRLTGSDGVTVLQHTDYINAIGQHRSDLAGVFEITGANDWVALEYAQVSGAVATWQPLDPLDGENMRSVNISFFGVRVT